jgi:hypothetical protein
MFALPESIRYSHGELLLANATVDRAESPRALSLRPYEARVYRLVAE